MVGAQQFHGPLYEQVRDRILDRIATGEWASGNPIPGEAVLSRDFGVSIGTVRKALDQLAKDRVVIRERGRGTYVKPLSLQRPRSGLRLCDDRGEPISSAIEPVEFAAGRASPDEAVALRLQRRGTAPAVVLRVTREWRTAGRIVCRETIVVDEARFPNFKSLVDPAAETFFEAYARLYRTSIERIDWSIGAPPAVADPSPTPGPGAPPPVRIQCVRTACDGKDTPIELCRKSIALDGVVLQLAG